MTTDEQYISYLVNMIAEQTCRQSGWQVIRGSLIMILMFPLIVLSQDEQTSLVILCYRESGEKILTLIKCKRMTFNSSELLYLIFEGRHYLVLHTRGLCGL